MARSRALNLSSLRHPLPMFDLAAIGRRSIDRRTGRLRSSFETVRGVQAEDAARARSLKRWVMRARFKKNTEMQMANAFTVEQAKAVMARLAPSGLDSADRTFASSAYFREYRRRFCGAALRAVARDPQRPLWLVTLVSSAWRQSADELASFDPRRLRESLRSILTHAARGPIPGRFIASLHADYCQASDTYQLHFHILCNRPFADFCRRMRDQKPRIPTFRKTDDVKVPIHILQLRDPARQVPYHIAQGFWPSKWTGSDGTRSRRRGRIPEPRHAEWLLWMDRQRFADLVWLHGMEIKNGRLVRGTKHKRTSSGRTSRILRVAVVTADG